MDLHDEEFLQLFRLLEKHNVEYLLVGGFAVNLHGHGRFTADLDIWLHDTPSNRKNLSQSFRELYGYEIPGVETMQFLPGWSSINLPLGFPLDIMTDMKGLEQFTFGDCLKQAQTVSIEGAVIRFLHINHLLANKMAVHRPKDIEDINELKRINNVTD